MRGVGEYLRGDVRVHTWPAKRTAQLDTEGHGKSELHRDRTPPLGERGYILGGPWEGIHRVRLKDHRGFTRGTLGVSGCIRMGVHPS